MSEVVEPDDERLWIGSMLSDADWFELRLLAERVWPQLFAGERNLSFGGENELLFERENELLLGGENELLIVGRLIL